MATAKTLRIRYKANKITRDVLKGLLVSGSIIIAMQSPYFVRNIIKYFCNYGWPSKSDRDRKKIHDTFSYLKKNNLLIIKKMNGQIYISLTKEGKKRAKYFQLDELKIKKSKKWDHKWRILMFDIPEEEKIKREALRGKLKEWGFCQLQKSVWFYPYKCDQEIKLLKEFFAFKDKHYILIQADNLGQHEKKMKKHFNLI